MSTQIPDANDLLLSGGRAPEPLKFTQLGVLIGGRVMSKPKGYHVREYDPRNPGSGAPKFDDNGNPIFGVHVDLDIAGVGIRRLYIDKPRLTTAVRDAMRAAGVQSIELDGALYAAWTGEEASNGGQPAKTWQATYSPPGAAPSPAAILATNGPVLPAAGLATVPASIPAQRQPFDLGAVAQQAVAHGFYGQATGATAPPATPAAPVVPASVPVAPAPETASQVTPSVNSVPSGPPVITETVAAAMRAAGIPTDGYTVVPG